jgi:hypothetical protein
VSGAKCPAAFTELLMSVMVGLAKDGVFVKIEEVGAEFQRLAFADSENPADGEVHIFLPGD